MAVIKGNFYSEALKMESHFCAVSPADSPHYSKDRQKILILLHGLTDGCDTWITQTKIEQYAMEHDLFVFMPDGHRSFWLDTAYGGAYQRLLAEEVPHMIEKLFGVTPAPDCTMIAGNSMGGFGALYTALKNPGMFAACGAFSPVISPVSRVLNLPGELRCPGEERYLFGADHIEEKQYDICSMLRETERVPRIFLACGTEDFLYGDSEYLHQVLEQERVDHIYYQTEGKHEWNFWDAAVGTFIEGGTGYF